MTPRTIIFSRGTNELQDAVRQFQGNADWRQIAAFFLGWVFFSSVRHVWRSCFVREAIAPAVAGAYNTVRGATPQDRDAEKCQSQLYMRLDATNKKHRSESSLLALLLFLAFGASSLTQFFSLLSFVGSESLCTVTLAFGFGTSIIARVIGLLSLSLDLKHRFTVRFCELLFFWFLLFSVLGITGGTIYLSLGRTVAVPDIAISLCVKRHDMPTSLTTSLILVILEAYTILRILFALELPRGALDVGLRRAAALLVFDLAVLVPDAITTNVLVDFLPFSITAPIVISVFAILTIPQQPALKTVPTGSSQSSVLNSSMLEPPRPLQTDANRSSPTPSQRAFHNSMMGVPSRNSYGLDPMQRLAARTQALNPPPNTMPPVNIVPGIQISPMQMPRPVSFASKKLPTIPQSDEHGFRPHSAAVTARSSVFSQPDNDSLHTAVVHTAVRRSVAPSPSTQPRPAVAMPLASQPPHAAAGKLPLSSKIMPLQTQFVEQFERENLEGLVPPPRRNMPRPQLAVDTAVRQEDRRIPDLEMTLTPNGPVYHRSPPPPSFDAEARARSMVSPAMMTPPRSTRRSRNRLTRVLSSPRTLAIQSPATSRTESITVTSAPAQQPSFLSMPFGAELEGAAAVAQARRPSNRLSQAPTFGRRRSRNAKHPNVPVTPDSDDGAGSGSLSALRPPIPPPWMARSVRSVRPRAVRGPRAFPNAPSSAPPM